jgi:glutaryl-CoA dehydrogenase
MARDICGGTGILLENRVIKHFLDMETIHTYEGTYEINMLVSGREITGGINAIKK